MPDWVTFEAFRAEVEQADVEERQTLVDALLDQRAEWPWIEANRATFVWVKEDTHSAALNLDTIKEDPPFVPMTHVEGTTLWYVTRQFEPDDLLDYLLAIDDPGTPLAHETHLVERVTQHWQPDPLNPMALHTAQINVSVLRMPQARPFPDWSSMPAVPRGNVTDHFVISHQLGFDDRKVWIYTPPGYDTSQEYPLLLLLDALWCIGPLQIPLIADALVKHQRMQPTIIAMMQSGTQETRPREFIGNDRHMLFLLTELLPFVRNHYRIDSLDVGVGGVGLGAIAAAHAALSSPAFSRLIMISPPLQGQGRGPGEGTLWNYRHRFETADMLPGRIFQSVGRYEAFPRFLKPARQLAATLENRSDVAYHFVEYGSGHGLVGFKGIMPEALSWAFTGEEQSE